MLMRKGGADLKACSVSSGGASSAVVRDSWRGVRDWGRGLGGAGCGVGRTVIGGTLVMPLLTAASPILVAAEIAPNLGLLVSLALQKMSDKEQVQAPRIRATIGHLESILRVLSSPVPVVRPLDLSASDAKIQEWQPSDKGPQFMTRGGAAR